MPRATRERETAAKLTLLLGTARQRASHIESGVHTRVVNTPATPAARQLVATLRTRLMAAAVTFTPDAGVQAVHAAWEPTIANLMSRREQDGVQGYLRLILRCVSWIPVSETRQHAVLRSWPLSLCRVNVS